MPETKAFKKLKASLASEYLGKHVPAKYQSRYGKSYGKKDIRSFAYAVAKSKHIPIDRK
jgi:hypothetical protein